VPYISKIELPEFEKTFLDGEKNNPKDRHGYFYFQYQNNTYLGAQYIKEELNTFKNKIKSKRKWFDICLKIENNELKGA
jgi:hypothetical protein